ncbi:MAG: hypothetical protein Q8N05_17935 [Bacteroidota bacterium]|nr:hypothetical protein [Bacteroidota bacterium]
MKKLFLFFILTIFSFTVLIAQERRGPSPELFEKIKAEKISFFTSKLELTPAEAQAFWPVYNEFEKKRFDIQRQIHDFERMTNEEFSNLSEVEIEKLTNSYIELFEREGLLRKEYHKQFMKILPMKKVLLMYRTENEFRGHLIREYRKSHDKE